MDAPSAGSAEAAPNGRMDDGFAYSARGTSRKFDEIPNLEP